MIQPHGSVWSTTYIDANPLPVVDKSLLPWLIKDRREAEHGSLYFNVKEGRDEHDKQGLLYAERELKRIKSDLASEKPDTNRAAILRWQAQGQGEQVEFWRGKIYLLDRVIEATKGRVE